jgi:hypothetical protein
VSCRMLEPLTVRHVTPSKMRKKKRRQHLQAAFAELLRSGKLETPKKEKVKIKKLPGRMKFTPRVSKKRKICNQPGAFGSPKRLRVAEYGKGFVIKRGEQQ